MNIEVHRWQWLRRERCVVCGRLTSRWFKVKSYDGQARHFHCLPKEYR